MTQVLLADDQALVRGGFRALLDAQPDIRVVGEAADGAQAVELVRRRRPDIVLMDIRMPRRTVPGTKQRRGAPKERPTEVENRMQQPNESRI